jgi:hypothetical protein
VANFELELGLWFSEEGGPGLLTASGLQAVSSRLLSLSLGGLQASVAELQHFAGAGVGLLVGGSGFGSIKPSKLLKISQ